MLMRAHATGQYINEGFGMFVGLRESRYLRTILFRWCFGGKKESRPFGRLSLCR